MRSASGHEADSGEERVMVASHPNAAISDTFGDASDAVMPTSALGAKQRGQMGEQSQAPKQALGVVTLHAICEE